MEYKVVNSFYAMLFSFSTEYGLHLLIVRSITYFVFATLRASLLADLPGTNLHSSTFIL